MVDERKIQKHLKNGKMKYKLGENIVIKDGIYLNVEGYIIDYFNENGIKKYGIHPVTKGYGKTIFWIEEKYLNKSDNQNEAVDN